MNIPNLIARIKYVVGWKSGRLMDKEGNQHWYFHWKPHRDEGLPAYVNAHGTTKKWYRFGDLHREGDLPAIEWEDGGVEYYKRGMRHRENGPAIIRANGDMDWYVNDQLHREDGPARVRPNGKDEYWLNGQMNAEGRAAAEKVKEEIKIKEEFDVAARQAEKTENDIQALKDLKNRKPPPSLKPR